MLLLITPVWGSNLRRCRYLFALVLGVIVLCSGCTVGPDYVRPATSAPPAYKELPEWKVAEPKDHVARGKWWEIFNDPQLNSLEEQVNISNQNIASAEAQFREARALVKASRAAYFPTVGGGASYTRSRSPVSTTSGRTQASSSSIVSDYSLPFDLTWELDIWGKVRRSVEASRANAQASAADLEGVRLLVQAELAQDYFQLRILDSQKQLLEATVEAYRVSLDLTKKRYAQGVASRADVLQAETQLKTTQAQAIDLGVQRAQTEHAIALLTGKPASVFSMPSSPLTAMPPSTPAGIPSELLERRPDIAAAERRMAASNAEIGVAVAAYFPTVTLSASGGFQATDIAKWLAWPSRFWSIGASLSQPLFEGGLRRAQTEQARAAYDASVATYRQTVLTGFQEVEDNLAALRILEQEAQVQDEAVKAAEQSLAVSTNQYKAGIINYLNVVVAQTTALNNERTAITILGSRMNAAVLLIKALGGGWNSSELPSAAIHCPGYQAKYLSSVSCRKSKTNLRTAAGSAGIPLIHQMWISFRKEIYQGTDTVTFERKPGPLLPVVFKDYWWTWPLGGSTDYHIDGTRQIKKSCLPLIPHHISLA